MSQDDREVVKKRKARMNRERMQKMRKRGKVHGRGREGIGERRK